MSDNCSAKNLAKSLIDGTSRALGFVGVMTEEELLSKTEEELRKEVKIVKTVFKKEDEI